MFHVSLFVSTLKIVIDSKSYVLTVPVTMSLKVLKYFSCNKISSFLFASLWQRDFKLGKLVNFFSEILTRATVGLIKKRIIISRKMLVCGWNLPYLKVKFQLNCLVASFLRNLAKIGGHSRQNMIHGNIF